MAVDPSAKKNDTAKAPETVIHAERVLQIPVPEGIERIDLNTVQLYFAHVSKLLQQEEHRLLVDKRLLSEPTFWVIVHPCLPMVSAGTSEVDEEHLVSVVAGWLTTLLYPGRILVHHFLARNIDAEIAKRLINHVATPATQRADGADSSDAIGMLGLCHTGGANIRWAQRTTRPTIDSTSSLTALLPKPMLNQTSESTLNLTQRVEVLTHHLKHLVSRETRRLTPGRPSWYWTAPVSDGRALAVVRTRGAQNATEFLSVLGLVRDEFSFEKSLTTMLRAWLLGLMKSIKGPICVVPDSSDSSHLLLLRLKGKVVEAAREIGERVTFLEPSELVDGILGASCIVVFADFQHKGTSIAKRRDQLVQTLLTQGTTSAPLPEIRSFVCVDGMRRKADPDWTLEGFGCQYDVTQLDFDDKAIKFVTDPVTNELMSPDEKLDIEPFYGLQQHRFQPDESTLSAGQSRKSPSAWVLSSSEFTYGLQFRGDRYIVCRWPIADNVRRPEVLDACAKILCDYARDRDAPRSLCVLYRRNSVLNKHLKELDELLRKRLTKSGCAIDVRWGAIDTVVIEGRQTLRHSVAQTIRSARPAGQFGIEWEEEHRNVSDEFDLVFFDNGAMTGRSLNEVLLSIASSPDRVFDHVMSVLLFPLVSRLSLVDERLMPKISVRRAVSNSADRAVKVSFACLIQHRAKTYRKDELVPLRAALDTVVQRSEYETIGALLDIRKAAQENLNEIGRQSSQTDEALIRPVRYPIFSTMEVTTSVTPIALTWIETRQLLELRQQGVPCWHDIIERITNANRSLDDAIGCITIFAVEPSLLSVDSIVAELGASVARLCRKVLLESGSRREVSNAVWVLSHLPDHFGEAASEAHRMPNDHLKSYALHLFVFLVLYSKDWKGRRNAAQSIREALAALDSTTRIELRGALASLARPALPIPSSFEEAKQVVRQFFVRARYRHGSDAYAVWQKVGESIEAPPRDELITHIALEQWFYDDCVPFAHAIEKLALRTGLWRAHSKEYLAERTDCERAFGRFVDLKGAREPSSVITEAWSDANTLFLGTSVDLLYDEPRMRPRSPQITQIVEATTQKNISVIARVLPVLVLEPVGTIISVMASQLSLQSVAKLSLSTPTLATLEEEIHVTDWAQKKLYDHAKFWNDGHGVALVWPPASESLLVLLIDLFKNVRKYVAPNTPIKLLIAIENSVGSGGEVSSTLLLTVINYRNPDVSGGRGTGIAGMKRTAAEIRGSFECQLDSESEVHTSRLSIPVEWLAFPIEN